MTFPELMDALGINPSVMAAGTAGGLLRALSRRRFKIRETIVSPICGMFSAMYLATPVVHYLRWTGLPLPDSDHATQNAAAFLIGMMAMYLADLVTNFVVRWFKGAQQQD